MLKKKVKRIVIYSLIVGPEGELYKCWHHLGIPEKSIGTINADLEITNVDLYADYMINGDALFDANCKNASYSHRVTEDVRILKNLIRIIV